MSYEIHANYEQTFLLPPSLADWVGTGHPARFVREFIDLLDLTALGFKVRESDNGRPNYSAKLLAKIVIYGNFEKVRSTRGLEKMCYNHLGMLWLTGMEHPDHNSIWRFLYHNKSAMKNLFSESVRLAMEMNLLGLVLQAVDGTKIAADVSKKKTLNRKYLKQILSQLDSISEEVLEQFEQNEDAESGLEYSLSDELSDRNKLRKSITENLSLLDAAGTNNLNTTDPDARKMKTRSGNAPIEFCYNAQAVVDDKSGIIVAADVVNDENDCKLLTEMIAQTEDNLGEIPQETVADAGYYSGEELAKAEDAGYEVLVNLPDNSSTKFGYIAPEFDKSNFIYDPETDSYTCPEGKRLIFEAYLNHKNGYRGKSYRCTNYKTCTARWKCSKAERGRKVSRPLFEESIKRQREKQKFQDNSEKLKRRKTIVEPIFGIIKRIMSFRRWSVRGLPNVQAQWSIVCCAYNLRKIYSIWAKCVSA